MRKAGLPRRLQLGQHVTDIRAHVTDRRETAFLSMMWSSRNQVLHRVFIFFHNQLLPSVCFVDTVCEYHISMLCS